MARSSNRLRIIGGSWRGRKLTFPDVEGLRPTPDRVRETLFNWLQAQVPGASCLDLFSGSGAFAFEALSRGADSCTCLDRDRSVTASLQAHAATLDAGERLQVFNSDALGWLQPGCGSFDIVFVDPPYRQGLVERCIGQLVKAGCLKAAARVYVEMAADEPLPDMPPGWELLRQKKAGQVMSYLFAVNGE